MPGYRCYFMTGDAIHAVQIFECADDPEVILRATALLDSKPEHQNIEIWEEPRIVARVPRHVQMDAALTSAHPIQRVD